MKKFENHWFKEKVNFSVDR